MRANLAVVLVLALAAVAHADDAPGLAAEVDVDRTELLDVIATTDGSIWKGVIVEQTPGVNYKIVLSGGTLRVLRADEVVSVKKERNPKFRAADAAPSPPSPVAAGPVAARPGRKPTGLVLGAGLTLAIPAGELSNGDNGSSVSPGVTVRGGYRYRSDNLSAQLGAAVKFIYWNVPGSPDQAFLYTIEPFAFVRAGLRGTTFEPFVELGLGPEVTGYDLTGLGQGGGVAFATTITAGVSLIATRAIDVELSLAYHPPLSPVPYANNELKITYYGLQLGGALHL